MKSIGTSDYRIHTGWILGTDVLSAVRSLNDSALNKLFEDESHSCYYDFFSQILLTGDSCWSVRWSDAYDFVRDFRGSVIAEKFAEKTLKIADINS